jgi:hypothetical protein
MTDPAKPGQPSPAPAPADPAVAALKLAKERADLRKAEADADKAVVEARNAAAAASVPKLPESPTSGKVTLGENAGLAEATMLGMKAVRSLAKAIALRLRAIPPAAAGLPPSFALVPMSALPDLQRWVAFVARAKTAQRRIESLLDDEGGAGLDAVVTAAGVSASVALVTTALNWLKPDHEFKGLQVDSSDPMLIAALADELLLRGVKVHLPAVQASVPALPDAATLEQLAAPFHLLDTAALWAAKATPHVARWTALQTELKAWCDALVTADATTGATPVQALVREARTASTLGEGALIVGLTLHKVVGSAHTKKGLFAGLGGAELLVSGAAVASYVAWAADSGEVRSAGLLPHHGSRERIEYAGRMHNVS